MTNQQQTEHASEWAKLVQSGNEAYAKRRHTEAELHFAAALRIAEKDAHPDELAKLAVLERAEVNSRLAKSLNNMAALYHTQGKYSMAEDLYKRCLELNQNLHGEEHLEVALNLHNLAVLFSAKRRYQEAEPLYKRSLALKERFLGEDNLELVTLLNNYALLFKRTGREEEGVRLEERAQRIQNSAAKPTTESAE